MQQHDADNEFLPHVVPMEEVQVRMVLCAVEVQVCCAVQLAPCDEAVDIRRYCGHCSAVRLLTRVSCQLLGVSAVYDMPSFLCALGAHLLVAMSCVGAEALTPACPQASYCWSWPAGTTRRAMLPSVRQSER